MEKNADYIKSIKRLTYDTNGLIPAIVQDGKTNKVLMFAYMNEESLLLTIQTGIAHFWSRSRKKIWKKGEISGHIQNVSEIRTDCDRDALLIKVSQTGGACHKGYETCFYETLDGDVKEKKVFDPGSVY